MEDIMSISISRIISAIVALVALTLISSPAFSKTLYALNEGSKGKVIVYNPEPFGIRVIIDNYSHLGWGGGLREFSVPAEGIRKIDFGLKTGVISVKSDDSEKFQFNISTPYGVSWGTEETTKCSFPVPSSKVTKLFVMVTEWTGANSVVVTRHGEILNSQPTLDLTNKEVYEVSELLTPYSAISFSSDSPFVVFASNGKNIISTENIRDDGNYVAFAYADDINTTYLSLLNFADVDNWTDIHLSDGADLVQSRVGYGLRPGHRFFGSASQDGLRIFGLWDFSGAKNFAARAEVVVGDWSIESPVIPFQFMEEVWLPCSEFLFLYAADSVVLAALVFDEVGNNLGTFYHTITAGKISLVSVETKWAGLVAAGITTPLPELYSVKIEARSEGGFIAAGLNLTVGAGIIAPIYTVPTDTPVVPSLSSASLSLGGSGFTLSANVTHNGGQSTVVTSYKWYKDGRLLSGRTSRVENFPESYAGSTMKCVATVKEGDKTVSTRGSKKLPDPVEPEPTFNPCSGDIPVGAEQLTGTMTVEHGKTYWMVSGETVHITFSAPIGSDSWLKNLYWDFTSEVYVVWNAVIQGTHVSAGEYLSAYQEYVGCGERIKLSSHDGTQFIYVNVVSLA